MKMLNKNFMIHAVQEIIKLYDNGDFTLVVSIRKTSPLCRKVVDGLQDLGFVNNGYENDTQFLKLPK